MTSAPKPRRPRPAAPPKRYTPEAVREFMREARRRAGVSQEQLASLIRQHGHSMSIATVRRAEQQGTATQRTIGSVRAALAASGVPVPTIRTT